MVISKLNSDLNVGEFLRQSINLASIFCFLSPKKVSVSCWPRWMPYCPYLNSLLLVINNIIRIGCCERNNIRLMFSIIHSRQRSIQCNPTILISLLSSLISLFTIASFHLKSSLTAAYWLKTDDFDIITKWLALFSNASKLVVFNFKYLSSAGAFLIPAR